jgi:hypothetical protein
VTNNSFVLKQTARLGLRRINGQYYRKINTNERPCLLKERAQHSLHVIKVGLQVLLLVQRTLLAAPETWAPIRMAQQWSQRSELPKHWKTHNDQRNWPHQQCIGAGSHAIKELPKKLYKWGCIIYVRRCQYIIPMICLPWFRVQTFNAKVHGKYNQYLTISKNYYILFNLLHINLISKLTYSNSLKTYKKWMKACNFNFPTAMYINVN